MRIFLAGASGVLGQRLVPLLVGAGHTVAGMTRSPEKAANLRTRGAEPVICDVYDAPALENAVVAFAPDTVMHQLTDLPDDPALLPEYRAANIRMSREGTRNLLGAARTAGTTRVLAQSVAWELTGEGERAKKELERSVLGVEGVVLRYGRFYGPGTYYPHQQPPPPRIHVDEAARRTVAELDAPSAVLTIVES